MVSVLLSERRADVAFQMGGIVGDEVGRVAMLRVAPSRFDRVQLRGVGGQPLDVDILEARGGEPLGGRAMHGPAIPTDDQGLPPLTAKLLHEVDDFVCVNVALVNLKRRTDVTPGGRERDRADHAQPIVPVPGPLHGRFAGRAQVRRFTG